MCASNNHAIEHWSASCVLVVTIPLVYLALLDLKTMFQGLPAGGGLLHFWLAFGLSDGRYSLGHTNEIQKWRVCQGCSTPRQNQLQCTYIYIHMLLYIYIYNLKPILKTYVAAIGLVLATCAASNTRF